MYFLGIPLSATYAAAVNSNVIKTFLANGEIKFFIDDKQAFINGPSILPRNQRDCIIINS